MKKNSIYILLICVLGFAIKAQAQDVMVTEFQSKLQNLDQSSAEQLERLINGPPSVLYVNDENNADSYIGAAGVVHEIALEKPSDAAIIENANLHSLSTVKVLSINWDGQSTFVLPESMLEKLSNLSYVYIRSYSPLTKAAVTSHFSSLIAQIQQRDGVEILFYTMEEPQ